MISPRRSTTTTVASSASVPPAKVRASDRAPSAATAAGAAASARRRSTRRASPSSSPRAGGRLQDAVGEEHQAVAAVPGQRPLLVRGARHDAQHGAGAGETPDVAASEHERRRMPRVRVAQRVGVDRHADERHEALGPEPRRQQARELAADGRGPQAAGQQVLERRHRARHQQRGRQALAADVRDRDREAAAGPRGRHPGVAARAPPRSSSRLPMSKPGTTGALFGSSRRWTASASVSSRRVRRRRCPLSTCWATEASTRALSHGFSTKSQTPSRMIATARGTVDQAVITMTGSVASSARTCGDELQALAPGGGVAREVEVHQQQVEALGRERRSTAAGTRPSSTS